MDGILASLLNFGIGGAMTAAFLYFCYHIVTRTIPAIFEQHKEDLSRLEERYERRDQAFQKTLETMCTRMESLDHSILILHGNLIRGNCPALANAAQASISQTGIVTKTQP